MDCSKQTGISLLWWREPISAEWGLALSCFPEKMSSWWQFMSLYNPNICLHVNGTFTIMQVIHTVCNEVCKPQHQDRCQLLHLSLEKVWLVLFIFETEYSIPSKKKLKLGLIWPQQKFPLSSRPSEWSSGQHLQIELMQRNRDSSGIWCSARLSSVNRIEWFSKLL